MRGFIVFSATLLVGMCVLTITMFWWITGWERAVQSRDYVPDGLRILVVDFPSDPNVIAYDPERVSGQSLEQFANALCGSGVLELSDRKPSLLNKLRGEKRAIIRCH